MIEKPIYSVLREEGSFELRRYKGFNIARISKTRQQDLNSGFNEIFNYISGANETGQKISMTAPVITTMTGDEVTTAFVMPREFSLEDLPEAKDGRVQLMAVDSGVFAAVRFSGTWSELKFSRHLERLRDWIVTQGWTIQSEEMIARYNPPFTPPFMRRNEILIRVKEEEGML